MRWNAARRSARPEGHDRRPRPPAPALPAARLRVRPRPPASPGRFAATAIAGVCSAWDVSAAGFTWMIRHRAAPTGTSARPDRRRLRDPRRAHRAAPSPLGSSRPGRGDRLHRHRLPDRRALSAAIERAGQEVRKPGRRLSGDQFQRQRIRRGSRRACQAAAIRFPVLKDPENRVADLLLAERTCEALVIDGSGRLRYRGAIDDQYALGSRRDEPAQNYLAQAIEAVLAGKPVSPGNDPGRRLPDRAHPAGTTSSNERSHPRRADRRSPPARTRLRRRTNAIGRTRSLTSSDVAAILHSRCATCHRPGQVAPFSLLTFDQARRWASAIAEAIDDGRMPPWHADPNHGHFANDRSLTRPRASV